MFLKLLRGGRNIQCMTNVYNSEPYKLLFLERDIEVMTVKKVLYTEKCKIWYKIEYESSSKQNHFLKKPLNPDVNDFASAIFFSIN